MTSTGEQTDIEQWRADVRTWLASVLPQRSAETDGPTDYAVFQNISEDAERELLDRVRAYRRERYDAGYGALALPREIGGGGLSMRHVVAFTAEEQAFATPQSTELISVTCGLVGPTIATFGTDEQRSRYARAFLRADLLCCQLFSEPGAGSDLAAVATRAVPDDGGWRLDGQKVWSSGARFADYGLLLARTDPDVAKQAGLTMFLVPDGRRGRRGAADPADERRVVVQRGLHLRPAPRRRHARRRGRRRLEGRERHARASSARPAARARGARAARSTTCWRWPAGWTAPATRSCASSSPTSTCAPSCAPRPPTGWPGPRPSARRPARPRRSASSSPRRTSPASARSPPSCWAARIAADTGEPEAFAWTEHLLGAPGYRLAGGTDEIQRNVIGERVLGLPREHRVDKGVPYSKLPRSG